MAEQEPPQGAGIEFVEEAEDDFEELEKEETDDESIIN